MPCTRDLGVLMILNRGKTGKRTLGNFRRKKRRLIA